VRRRLPLEDIVYLADQAHVPYGERSENELERLLASNVGFLEDAGVGAVVMGCNTSCAVAAKRGWPPARVPIFDLIVAAAGAVRACGAGRVGVLATTATARSGAYAAALRRDEGAIDVQEVAAPQLVPLVERGIVAGPLARAAVRESLAPFVLPLDALVLACTHYPFLEAEFAAALPGVRLLDPAVAQAEIAVRFVAERGGCEAGRTRYVTTGPLDAFRAGFMAIAGTVDAQATFERVAGAKLIETV